MSKIDKMSWSFLISNRILVNLPLNVLRLYGFLSKWNVNLEYLHIPTLSGKRCKFVLENRSWKSNVKNIIAKSVETLLCEEGCKKG